MRASFGKPCRTAPEALHRPAPPSYGAALYRAFRAPTRRRRPSSHPRACPLSFEQAWQRRLPALLSKGVIDKRFNRYIGSVHFRMETLASILPYLDPGDSTVSIDLLDTYLHVPSRSVKRLARLYIQRKRLSLQSTALRAQARTSPIHEASRMRGRFPPSAGVVEIFCYLDD